MTSTELITLLQSLPPRKVMLCASAAARPRPCNAVLTADGAIILSSTGKLPLRKGGEK